MPTSIDTVDNLIGELRRCRLLTLNQLTELSQRGAGGFADARALGQHLVQKGWLTTYQLGQLMQGNGQDLVLGQYIVLERLGEGATGQVFKARHLRLQRIAALKVIRPELLAQEEAIGRFYREIQATSQLSHAHIVKAYDAGPVNGTHLLAMEFVDGINLERLVKQKGPLPVNLACSYIQQAALGLHHAFERGLVHRDIKPSNLMLTKAPGAQALGLVKLLDLGLVQLSHGIGSNGRTMNTLTESGTLIGTPDFMAPEQVENPHRVDIRADVYSLGCTLYFLLSGKLCFPDCTLFQKLLRIQQQEPKPIEQLRPGLPAGLPELVRKMMAKRLEKRLQSPADVVAGLASFTGKGANATAQRGKSTMDGSRKLTPLVRGVLSGLSALPTLHRSLPTPLTSPNRTRHKPWGQRLRSRRLWLALGAAMMLFMSCGLLGTGYWLVSGFFSEESRAEQALRPLLVQAADPAADQAQLRSKLLAVRVTYPGTPAAQRVAEVLMRLPSPMDKLDDQPIPKEESFPWQPPELMAVLGTHQQPPPSGERTVYSPGSHMVVTLTRLNTLEVTQLSTGKVRTTIQPRGPISGFLIAPGGQKLVTINPDRTMQVWDVTSGQAETQLPALSSPATTANMDDQAQLLVTGSVDRAVRVWDVATGKLKATLEGHARTPRAVAVSPGGQAVASASEDGVFKVWDLATGHERCSGAHGQQVLRQVMFTSGGKRLLTVSAADATMKVWDAATGQECFSLVGHRVAPHALIVSPDGTLLATASADQLVKIWDLATGRDRVTLTGTTSTLQYLYFSPDGKTLTAWGQDRTLRQWDTTTGRPIGLLRGPAGWLRALAFAPDGQALATGSLGGTVKVCDAATLRTRTTLAGHAMAVTALAYTPDGKILASASQDQTVKLYDLPDGQVRATLQVPSVTSTALAFAPDATRLAAGYSDGTIRLWDVANGKERATLRGHGGAVRSMAYAPDGQTLVSGGEDGTVRFWKCSAGEEIASLKEQRAAVRGLALAPSGKSLAIGDDQPGIHLWDVAGLPPHATSTLSGHTTAIEALAFRPDGKQLASASEDGRVIVWPTDGGAKLRDWPLSGAVIGVAFAVDGRHLATVNGNGTVYIFRVSPRTAGR